MTAEGHAGSYAIATPHTAATAAGVAAFEAGGNAVDAALAAACAIAVVYPHMNAVGGDVMALVHDGAGHAVNGSGRAPAGIRPGPVPLRGVGAITVPGAVRAWETLAERWGSWPLSRALEGAAALARGGVAVAPSLARTIVDCRELIAADAGLSAVFAPGGRLLAEGETLMQERLGATLERLAERGADDLYGGETGAMLIAGLRALGAPLATADLEAHRTDVAPALRHRVLDEDYLTMGPNSQGYLLPQIMAVAERVRLSDPFGHGAPMLSAILALAAADRDAHLADPAAMRIGVADLLSDDHVTALADEAVGMVGVPTAWPRATGDTIALVAADGSGLAVSLIQSIFYGFGSGVLEPSTGSCCHNRGACFSADPGSPNAPAPGKRPLHTLMPLMVERAGRVRWVAGTMGGHAQPQIHAQLLLRRRAGADAQAAVAAPRFIVGDVEPGAAIAVEAGFDSAWKRSRTGARRRSRSRPAAASPATRMRSRWPTTAHSTRALTRAPTGRRRPAADPGQSPTASTAGLGPAGRTCPDSGGRIGEALKPLTVSQTRATAPTGTPAPSRSPERRRPLRRLRPVRGSPKGRSAVRRRVRAPPCAEAPGPIGTSGSRAASRFRYRRRSRVRAGTSSPSSRRAPRRACLRPRRSRPAAAGSPRQAR